MGSQPIALAEAGGESRTCLLLREARMHGDVGFGYWNRARL